MGKQITFKDLLRILRTNVKIIGIVMLAVAILLGGYSIVSQINVDLVQEDESSLNISQEFYSARVAEFEDWVEKGIYLKINAWNAAVYEKVLIFEQNERFNESFDSNNTTDKESRVAEYYVNATQLNIVKQKTYDRLKDKVDLHLKDLNYIVYCETINGSNAVDITAVSEDIETSKLVLNTISDVLEEHLKSAYQDITIRIASEDGYFKIIDSTFETQKSLMSNYENDKIMLENAQLELPVEEQSSNSISIKKVILFLILGAFVGFVGCFVILVIISVNRKSPIDIRDINARYNIRVMGVMNIDEDKLNSNNNLKADSQIELIAHSLKVLSQNKKILLTGSIEQEVFDKIATAMSSMWGLDILSGGCVLETPSTIDKLGEVDTVVLLEQLGESKYNRINKQILRLEALEKEISAFIVIKTD